MRNSKVMMAVFISVLCALLVHCSASEFNLSAQKVRGDDRMDFTIVGSLEYQEYHAVLKLGESVLQLHIDTGSSFTWVQCAGHNPRRSPNPPYMPSATNYILKNDPDCPTGYAHAPPDQLCDYYLSYADGGSSNGFAVREFVTLHSRATSSSIRPKLVFGCGHFEQHNVGEQIKFDGVLGVGRQRSSFSAQLNALGLARNFFAHCFSRRGQGGLSGFGFFGRGDLSQLPPAEFWLPLLPSPAHYYVLGQARFSLDGMPEFYTDVPTIIVDSGTTYITLSQEFYDPIENMVMLSQYETHLNLVQGDTLDVCWSGGRGPFQRMSQAKRYFKAMRLDFGMNRVIVLQPEDYLIISPSGNVCLGILNSDVHFGHGVNMLGDIAMLDKWVMYDNRRSVIGWGASDTTRCTNRGRSSTLETSVLAYVSTNASSNGTVVPHGARHDLVGS